MTPQSLAVIVNPRSSSGRTRRTWPRVEPRLASGCGPMITMETRRPGHGIALAAEAVRSGYRTIVAVGGDGTLNEVVNGWIMEDGLRRDARIGWIPQGTGSDFRRAAGLPLHAGDAVETIRRGRTATVDAMRIDYRHADGTGGSRYALNLTSFGMGGTVAARVNRSSRALTRLPAFLMATVATAVRFPGNRVSLVVDGGEWRDLLITNVAVGNGQYHGGGMRVCPRAAIDDGLLDVTIIERLSAWEILRNIHMLFNGHIEEHPKVHCVRTRRVWATSGETCAIEIDGEPIGHLPLEITVVPKAVRLIVP